MQIHCFYSSARKDEDWNRQSGTGHGKRRLEIKGDLLYMELWKAVEVWGSDYISMILGFDPR